MKDYRFTLFSNGTLVASWLGANRGDDYDPDEWTWKKGSIKKADDMADAIQDFFPGRRGWKSENGR